MLRVRDQSDAPDLDHAVAELVERETVPFLPILYLTTMGERKRVEWEETWRLQRLEEATHAAASKRPAAALRRANPTLGQIGHERRERPQQATTNLGRRTQLVTATCCYPTTALLLFTCAHR